MINQKFELPTGECVRLIFGETRVGERAMYLQGVRSGLLGADEPEDKIHYERNLKFGSIKLACEAKSHAPHVDAVVSPPSSRNDADPYREAILRILPPRTIDLTTNFSRNGSVKSGDAATTLSQLINNMSYAPCGLESSIGSLVIVDDLIAQGKTVAALLDHIRHAGLKQSADVTVVAIALI